MEERKTKEPQPRNTSYSTEGIRIVPLKFDRILEEKECFRLELKGALVGTLTKDQLAPKLLSMLKSMADWELSNVSRD